MTVRLLAAADHPTAVCHVAANMRAWDHREIGATRWDDPSAIAHDVLTVPGFAWVAIHDNTPAAVIGALPRWPGVWGAFAFGTDDWPRVALTLTRHVRRTMIPALYAHGVHRVEAASMVGHDTANAWLRALGAREEARMRGFGKGGEDFILFVWDRDVARAGSSRPA